MSPKKIFRKRWKKLTTWLNSYHPVENVFPQDEGVDAVLVVVEAFAFALPLAPSFFPDLALILISSIHKNGLRFYEEKSDLENAWYMP